LLTQISNLFALQREDAIFAFFLVKCWWMFVFVALKENQRVALHAPICFDGFQFAKAIYIAPAHQKGLVIISSLF
jgi:hypothetical protein